MAGTPVVSPHLEQLLNKLNSLASLDQRKLRSVANADIRTLQTTVSRVKEELQDFERRLLELEVTDDLLSWLQGTEDAAFEADNLLDELQVKAWRWQQPDSHGSRGGKSMTFTSKVCDLFPSPNCLPFLFKMGRKTKHVLNLFDQTERKKPQFKLTPRDVLELYPNAETPLTESGAVYGRESDKKKVIDFLIKPSPLSVLPIIGLGGVGKTTLAQLVCNDERVKEHFDLQMWTLVKNLVKQSDREAIQERFRHQHGFKKRFLLVLDDVCNADAFQWEELLLFFIRESGCDLESKIIVTTSSIEVAGVVESKMIVTNKKGHSVVVADVVGTGTRLYRLNTLPEDDCWTLFKELSKLELKTNSSELEEIGMEIIKKCRGLPHLAKALGCLMSLRHQKEDWLAIQNLELWKLPEPIFRPILRLSEDGLPSNLKQCLSYCSLFPRGHMIDRLKLIQIWIAEEFIHFSEEEGQQAEDIGNDYLNIFISRYFFDYIEKDDRGNIVSCRMNEWMHQLAFCLAREEFIMKVSEEESFSHRRYASLTFDDGFPSLFSIVCHQAKKN